MSGKEWAEDHGRRSICLYLNGCHATSPKVASGKQQKWTLNGLCRKVNYGVVHKITGKAIQPGLKLGTNKEGLLAARIPSQIIPQNQPSTCIVLPPHWTCDLMASTDVTLALNPGHHWCSPALLPLETQSFRISCYYLLLYGALSVVCFFLGH